MIWRLGAGVNLGEVDLEHDEEIGAGAEKLEADQKRL